MSSEYQANKNGLLSGLIWGVILSSISRVTLQYLPYGLWNILWYGGNFLALMLYPIIVSALLRKKTGLWINTFFFSACGSSLSVFGSSMIRLMQVQAWTNLGVNIALLTFVAWKLWPLMKKNYALESEHDAPNWRMLNDFSLTDFLFCRFNSVM